MNSQTQTLKELAKIGNFIEVIIVTPLKAESQSIENNYCRTVVCIEVFKENPKTDCKSSSIYGIFSICHKVLQVFALVKVVSAVTRRCCISPHSVSAWYIYASIECCVPILYTVGYTSKLMNKPIAKYRLSFQVFLV
jgi:hypothetical protein